MNVGKARLREGKSEGRRGGGREPRVHTEQERRTGQGGGNLGTLRLVDGHFVLGGVASADANLFAQAAIRAPRGGDDALGSDVGAGGRSSHGGGGGGSECDRAGQRGERGASTQQRRRRLGSCEARREKRGAARQWRGGRAQRRTARPQASPSRCCRMDARDAALLALLAPRASAACDIPCGLAPFSPLSTFALSFLHVPFHPSIFHGLLPFMFIYST